MAHPPLWPLKDGSTAQTVVQCSLTLISCRANRDLPGSADVRPTPRLQHPQKAFVSRVFCRICRGLTVLCRQRAALSSPSLIALRAERAWPPAIRGSRSNLGPWRSRSRLDRDRHHHVCYPQTGSRRGNTRPRRAGDPDGIWPLVCQGIRTSRELSSRRSATGGRCTASVPACPPREGSVSSSAAASRGAGA